MFNIPTVSLFINGFNETIATDAEKIATMKSYVLKSFNNKECPIQNIASSGIITIHLGGVMQMAALLSEHLKRAIDDNTINIYRRIWVQLMDNFFPKAETVLINNKGWIGDFGLKLANGLILVIGTNGQIVAVHESIFNNGDVKPLVL